MNISDDIIIIRELLNITQQELANYLNVSFELINRWENNISIPENKNINLIYSFAYDKKIYLNKIHEQMLKDEYNKDNHKVLFHGAKSIIKLPLDLDHSKTSNDFGLGFYLGENLEQASTYIAYSKSNLIYPFVLDTSDLSTIRYDVSLEWMLAIAYYRGWIDKYKDSKLIKDIRNKVDSTDIIIAPIADNKMFTLIDEFVSGYITDMQAKHALSATNLGNQYVIKNNKGLNKLEGLDMLFLCDREKEDYISARLESSKIEQDKVKVARIEYKNIGKYIEEILK